MPKLSETYDKYKGQGLSMVGLTKQTRNVSDEDGCSPVCEITIVDYLKPAHTHFVDLLEPSAPIEYDHWVIGISELGMTTDLH